MNNNDLSIIYDIFYYDYAYSDFSSDEIYTLLAEFYYGDNHSSKRGR